MKPKETRQIMKNKGRGSDSDSWNNDDEGDDDNMDFAADSMDFGKPTSFHRKTIGGKADARIGTIMDQYTRTLPPIMHPNTFSFSKPSLVAANGDQPRRRMVLDSDSDGALSDITQERSPIAKKNGVVSTTHQGSKNSQPKVKVHRAVMDEELTFQPTIVTKDSATSSKAVWRKLKPIPVAPYVPISLG